MDLIQNKYQLSKTLRFGLTLKQKTKKKNYIGDVYESHTELKDLVKFSEDKIKFEIKHSSDANIPVEDIKKSLDWINKFLEAWEKIYHRTDQLALEKDYYKKLSRKIGFQGFWYYKKDNELVKRPQSREIKLSELVREDEHGKKRNTYIIEFWSNIIQKAKEKLYETEAIFEKFESAIKSNRDDDRPNEVEMRKMFISLANIINEVLLPLCNNSISFPNIEKLINNEESKILREFALDDEFRMNLLNLLEELKIYFSENGGNVPYCRATLNPMTGIKKPELTDNSINKEVDLTGVEKYLQSNTQHIDKFKAIQDESLPLIERGLLFKYKTIPAVVQFDLAKVLAEKTGKSLNEMRTIIRTIGLPQSPAKDYADMQDKSEFNIHNYPLKVAFDYAWENLAKAVYHPDLDFPKQQCEKFLKDIFGVVTDNNADFKLYSQLLYLRELLAALEHGKPADVKSIVEKAQQLLEEIKWNDVSYNKGAGYKKAISDWLKTRSKNDEKFQKAKQQVGLIRGGLKNKIKRFKTLTEAYKDIAMKLGKAFADMRDKITGAVELNKISHYATIIEDRNNDKYVLIEKLIVGENPSILGYFDEEGELITYSVNSVTSAAINKMIRKIRAGELQKNENNKQQSDTISDERREAENLLRWKKFIESKQWD
ncbi:MAG: hypothetical protein N2510_05065, partial [Ignavibacteria bacterium]|nr:hypothetical protein [Ignavibacteria bacterium]